MYYKKKIRAFVLLEILISLGLAMGLISMALYFYRYATWAEIEMKNQQEKAFAERVIQSRLTKVFSHVRKGYFFSMPEDEMTLGSSVVFSAISDSRLQAFYKEVIVRLLVDKQKRLIMAIWQDNSLKSDEQSPPMHLEVLAENIDGINFQFLVGEPNEKEEAKNSLSPGNFAASWPYQDTEFQDTPRAIKIQLNGKSDYAWAFPLPECIE